MKMPNNNEMYADKNCTTTHSPNSSCSHHKNSSTTPSERETFSPLSDKELEVLYGGLPNLKSIIGEDPREIIIKVKKEMYEYEKSKKWPEPKKR